MNCDKHRYVFEKRMLIYNCVKKFSVVKNSVQKLLNRNIIRLAYEK